MNILEKYATNCGVKIREPHVPVSYFPLREQEYIIIDNRCKYNTNIYECFSDVMSYIHPVLKKHEISVYSFDSDENNVIEGALPFIGLFKKQESYLIKNSRLVLGSDNLSNYIAAAFRVPSIGLYSAYPACSTAPLWGDNHVVIESHRDGNLPGYGIGESPRTINFIEPEKIANQIFKSLEIDHIVEHETFYMGDLYPTRVVEVIPDFIPPSSDFLSGRAVNLRMDYHFDEESAIRWLDNRNLNILTDKPINLNLLKYFKKNIAQLTININDSFDEPYLKQAKAAGINVQIFCENNEKLSDYRFKLFDFDVNESMFKKKDDLGDDLNKINENTKFLSGKVLLSDGKKYSCYEAKKAKKELTGAPEVVYDSNDFWKELDHYRLINDL
jgi:hypothetical protein